MTVPANSPVLKTDLVEQQIENIMRGGEEIVHKVSGDISKIGIMRAMQFGYEQCCEDHGLEKPIFADPAEELGYLE